MMLVPRQFVFFLVTAVVCFRGPAVCDEPLRIATFDVDATPPIGSPVAYAPTRKILDSLSARGIVLLAGDRPIVLCAVDWIGIGNGGNAVWREELARAAGTTVDRVAVHTLHQHDGPRCDFTAEALLAQRGLSGKYFDGDFARRTIGRAAEAIRAALKDARAVTHLGVGKAKVEKVASNRRVLGPDGKVKIVRWSKTADPEAIAAPEGLIDPYVRMLSFWGGDRVLACVSYYATHPQSYYGEGDVTADFVGIARALREADLPDAAHIHFNGAGGNITAGKYNDGSEKMRPILATRLADGMRRAWEDTVKTPLSASEVEWRSRRVRLPVGGHLVEDKLLETLDDPEAEPKARLAAASNLAWVQRNSAGHAIDVGCLRLGMTYVLHMPGELLVEYQLAAQKMKPGSTVCMAAYGDYGPGYIGTEIAYSQGGYETSPGASRVAPNVEGVLVKAIRELLAGAPPRSSSAESKLADETPLVRVVDLKVGESQVVELRDGRLRTVELLGLDEVRDDIRGAVRVARAKVEIDGRPVTLSSGNYNLPVTAAGVQIDCSVTRGYLKDSSEDRWGLVKDARLRLWPAGSSLIRPGTFVYPVKQRWFATYTWMGNEPVDGGKRFAPKIYYHSGLDIGGAEGLVEVVAATDGLVVSRGTESLPGYEETPVAKRYDVVYLLDERGWYYRYSHLESIHVGVRLGQRVKMGQKIGMLGKEGGSGGWSHLHFEIKSRQPSGKWGTQAGYAYLWEAYRRQYAPDLMAVARPSQLASTGDEVVFDASRSWSAGGGIVRYEWIFDDGTTASGVKAGRTYERPGSYSEILRITDSAGRVDYDFPRVLVVDRDHPDRVPPYTHPVYFPTFSIRPGDPVTFKVRSFNVTAGVETWDFGDGSPPVKVKSDGNVDQHARDGYAVTTHAYREPGHYLVRVERTDRFGQKAVGRLQVRVGVDDIPAARTGETPGGAEGYGDEVRNLRQGKVTDAGINRKGKDELVNHGLTKHSLLRKPRQ